jgi:hypothetical protein
MSKVQDVVSEALAAELLAHAQWDEPPALHTVYYRGGEAVIGQVPVPDEVWASGPPAQVLASLASSVTRSPLHTGLLRALAPEYLHGIAFFSEVWVVEARARTPEGDDLHKRASAVGYRVGKLPERREARSIICVDRAGVTYSVMQLRGEDDIMRDMTYPKPGSPPPATTGTVPEALDKMVTAFTGVTLPVRVRDDPAEADWDKLVQP